MIAYDYEDKETRDDVSGTPITLEEAKHIALNWAVVGEAECVFTKEDYFEEFGSRISHFHLTDGTPAGHVPCGTGEHPVSEYLDVLQRYGYSGYITLEIGDTGCCIDPEKATRTGFETVRNLCR